MFGDGFDEAAQPIGSEPEPILLCNTQENAEVGYALPRRIDSAR